MPTPLSSRRRPNRAGSAAAGSTELARYGASALMPDFFADSILDIDFAALRKLGVRYLVLDVDHTLAAYRAIELSPPVVAFLRQLRARRLIDRLYIASNSRRDLQPIARSIGAEIVRPGRLQRKPSRAFYRKLLRTIGCRPAEAVMVGDKLINDVWGGNRAGMYTVLVKPIGPDILIDRILLRRYWGERFLRKRRRGVGGG